MKFLILAFSVLLFATTLDAQRMCGSAEYTRLNSAIVSGTVNTGSYTHRDTVANEIITIPVVVHVLYHNAVQNISNAQILSQLKVLNEDFRRMNADAANTPAPFRNVAADCRIMFCLSQIDPRGRPSTGIIRKYTSKTSFTLDDAVKFSAAGGDDAWDSKKYLNIWICNMQGNAIGYASVPGSQPDKDGIVIQYDVFGNTGVLRPDFNKGRTATHEVAHWMGLKHIWGDNLCGSDGIDDTPQQSNYNNGCPLFPRMSGCSPDANGDMFMNFMDYTNDACMNIFTQGQKSKMRSQFAVNGPRNSLMTSFACDSTLTAGGDLPTPVDTTTIAKPEPSLTVFPNPVQNDIHLKANHGYVIKDRSAKILNAQGMVVARHLIRDAEVTSIQVSHLKAGVYYLMVGEGNDRKTIKIIKL
jgi:hypothetical protein